MTLSRSIHVSVNETILFLFYGWVQYTLFHCIYGHIFSIHSVLKYKLLKTNELTFLLEDEPDTDFSLWLKTGADIPTHNILSFPFSRNPALPIIFPTLTNLLFFFVLMVKLPFTVTQLFPEIETQHKLHQPYSPLWDLNKSKDPQMQKVSMTGWSNGIIKKSSQVPEAESHRGFLELIFHFVKLI